MGEPEIRRVWETLMPMWWEQKKKKKIPRLFCGLYGWRHQPPSLYIKSRSLFFTQMRERERLEIGRCFWREWNRDGMYPDVFICVFICVISIQTRCSLSSTMDSLVGPILWLNPSKLFAPSFYSMWGSHFYFFYFLYFFIFIKTFKKKLLAFSTFQNMIALKWHFKNMDLSFLGFLSIKFNFHTFFLNDKNFLILFYIKNRLWYRS